MTSSSGFSSLGIGFEKETFSGGWESIIFVVCGENTTCYCLTKVNFSLVIPDNSSDMVLARKIVCVPIGRRASLYERILRIMCMYVGDNVAWKSISTWKKDWVDTFSVQLYSKNHKWSDRNPSVFIYIRRIFWNLKRHCVIKTGIIGD